ncbi:MAG TPA: aromatic-ring-hydroxylating dioxygenase subunit beta [Steroidobacteraceae bacterium]|nr:aromatic-ring-hydroxylating dioxygenase subunit beta [Steroidobacteraceae bacterium]
MSTTKAAATVADETLVAFVYNEARLVDEKRFNEWYELFAEDGRYWIPLTRNQPEGRLHTSLMYEDKLLLRVRIDRLGSPNAFSQIPPSWCQHVLQRPEVEQRDAANGFYVLRTPFIYAESQGDRQDIWAGVAWHRLSWLNGGLLIREKKVELLNCDGALPSLQLFP